MSVGTSGMMIDIETYIGFIAIVTEVEHIAARGLCPNTELLSKR
jgi:hypothetical protein